MFCCEARSHYLPSYNYRCSPKSLCRSWTSTVSTETKGGRLFRMRPISNIGLRTILNLRRPNYRTFTAVVNKKSAATHQSLRKSIVGSNGSVSSFCTENAPVKSEDELPPIIIYEGAYCTKLRCLRIVSFGSSVFCTIGLPLGLAFTGMGGSVPFVGQVLIASTAIFISLSSTAFLQLVTHPYTVMLKEIPQKGNEGKTVALNDRVFRATRVGVYGQFRETEFTLKDAARLTTSAHPFASVKIKGSFFYIFGRHFEDVPLRHALTNEL